MQSIHFEEAAAVKPLVISSSGRQLKANDRDIPVEFKIVIPRAFYECAVLAKQRAEFGRLEGEGSVRGGGGEEEGRREHRSHKHKKHQKRRHGEDSEPAVLALQGAPSAPSPLPPSLPHSSVHATPSHPPTLPPPTVTHAASHDHKHKKHKHKKHRTHAHSTEQAPLEYRSHSTEQAPLEHHSTEQAPLEPTVASRVGSLRERSLRSEKRRSCRNLHESKARPRRGVLQKNGETEQIMQELARRQNSPAKRSAPEKRRNGADLSQGFWSAGDFGPAGPKSPECGQIKRSGPGILVRALKSSSSCVCQSPSML